MNNLKNDIQLTKANIKLKLKSKTDKLVSQDKELFANLSKENITKEKKERANSFRKENADLLNENKLLIKRKKVSQYKEAFDQRDRKNVLENKIKDSFVNRSLSTLKSVNNPGGISEVLVSDTEGDFQLVAMENRVWIRMWQVLWGWGIRHTHYVSLMNWNDELFSSEIIVRDEYYPDKDRKDERIRDVKILGVENDKVVVAIEKSGKFEVKEFDIKNNKLLNEYALNNADLETLKKKRMDLDFSRDEKTLKYNKENINDVLRKKYKSCEIIEVQKWTYIVLGINTKDWRYTGVDCFLLQDWRRDFKKTTIDISGIDQYHFRWKYPSIESSSNAKLVESWDNNVSVGVEFVLKEDSYYQQDSYYGNPRTMGSVNLKVSLDKK